jgi:hypothetical protein
MKLENMWPKRCREWFFSHWTHTILLIAINVAGIVFLWSLFFWLGFDETFKGAAVEISSVVETIEAVWEEAEKLKERAPSLPNCRSEHGGSSKYEAESSARWPEPTPDPFVYWFEPLDPLSEPDTFP